MKFSKPTQESDYFKGILRKTKAFTLASGSYGSYPNDHTAIVQNNLNYHWHSIYDSSFSQYIEIILPYSTANVTSYMISSGNNGKYYLKSWKFICTMDGYNWVTLDSRKDEPQFTASRQMKIFDTQVDKECKVFRIAMNGVESEKRNYMYLGPVEFYGTISRTQQIAVTRINCKRSHTTAYYIIYLLYDK